MRRNLVMTGVAIVLIVGAAGCTPSPEERAQRAELRAKRESVLRGSEIVARVATPRDSGRIIYDSPPSLSADNLARTRAAIVGLDKPVQPSEPAAHSGPPAH